MIFDMLKELLITNPTQFCQVLSHYPERFSLEFAAELDAVDPLAWLAKHFRYEDIKPFAAHSLGPVFQPALDSMLSVEALRSRALHEGHFPQTESQGGNWFDCDQEKEAMEAAQAMLGFSEPCEFMYTQTGLSDNLRLLMANFYKPTAKDWRTGKTKICFMGEEFFSDQAVIHTLLDLTIQVAEGYEVFDEMTPKPEAGQLTLKLLPDEKGLYNEEAIIEFVKAHAKEIQILHLSDVVFSTGQRLNLPRILSALKPVIEENNLIVGLDLAHSVANRTLNLKELPVTYAVGCAYKHGCGPAGSGYGFYVNSETNLTGRYRPIQGWKAAESDKVFAMINGYDPAIMLNQGAWAFRCSNPAPLALAPAKAFMIMMNRIGWDKLIAKSECLTRYLYAMLQHKLGDKIEFITPEDPEQRGAMLVFRVKNLSQVNLIETMLKEESAFGRFEIDVRKPNNIRVTAHYGFTRFADIHNMVSRLEEVIKLVLNQEQTKSPTQSFFGRSGPSAPAQPFKLMASL